MNPTRRLVLSCAVALTGARALAPASVRAATPPLAPGTIARLTDLGTQGEIRVDLRWRTQPTGARASPGGGRLEADDRYHQMEAVIPLVEHRLDVRRWTGRPVRIWYVIPAAVPGLTSPQGLQVHWEGGARLGTGSARPGDRVPFFTGVPTEPLLVERLRLTLVVDSRLFTGRLRYEPIFELEER